MTVVSPDTSGELSTITLNGTQLHVGQQQHLHQPQQLSEQRHRHASAQRRRLRRERHDSTDPGLGQSIRRSDLQHRDQPDLEPCLPAHGEEVPDVVLTATVTSNSNQANTGATVAFSQSTTNGYQTSTSVISSCSSVALSTPTAVTPATNPPTYQATATCSTTESSNSTGAFSAAYSGGTYAASSSANLGQTNTLTAAEAYGPYSQVTAGGCNSCYYGEQANPDGEGDAFVNGSLSGQLTIGTANNVIVDGNITYADCNWTTGPSGTSARQRASVPTTRQERTIPSV